MDIGPERPVHVAAPTDLTAPAAVEQPHDATAVDNAAQEELPPPARVV